MRKIVIVVFVVFFLVAGFMSVSVADDFDKAIEQKKTAIMKIMSQGQFKAYIQDDKKFCATFLKDFKQQKNIEHIKPIVEVDDYNAPKLQDYLKQCPKAEFHQSVVAETPSQMRTCDEGEDPCGWIYYATKNFKLYKVNIDNNPKNGDEYVFYAEGYKVREIDKYTSGGYRIIDFKKCEIRDGVSTTDPFDYYEKQQPIENYNGIIKHKGQYYIFEVKDRGDSWELSLTAYNKKYEKMLSTCEFSQIKSKKGGN